MVEQGARRAGAECPGERLAPRLGDEDDVRLLEVAPEPRGASFEVTARVPAGKLLEEVLDEVLLRELLDYLNLLDPDGDLTRDRSSQLDARASLGNQETDELSRGYKWNGESRAPATAGELGSELGEPERLAGVPGLGIARDSVELLTRGVEEVDVARASAEQRRASPTRPSARALRAPRHLRSPLRAR